ncbi:MAG: tryptophan 2,3-dioxygenase family protein [Candidatus Melainabacteria bacterium]|nr:tryptophan 2,3-dioxygenase family protein [Candidatus Melainabacteria bacterium]
MTTQQEQQTSGSGVHYASYLALDRILGAQHCLTEAHDELQFIVIHQVFELWFKLILFELDSVRERLMTDQVTESTRYLNRITEIMRAIVGSFPVIETMSAHDFLAFRSQLSPASGFQSLQFREIEFLSGQRNPQYLAALDPDSDTYRRLAARLAEPSLWEAFVGLLARAGFTVAQEADVLDTLVRIQTHPAEYPLLNNLIETLLDYDEAFILWRQRHLSMTERMIGRKPGTGQPDVARYDQYGHMSEGGVAYLSHTLGKKFFPLLWQARTQMG